MAAHAAYAQAGKLPEASREALDAAVADGIRNIEIDLSLFSWGPVLYHPFVADVETARSAAGDAIPLGQFFATYASAFDLIFFDVKNVLLPVDDALESLRGFPWDPTRDIVIGRKCPLLREIRDAFGVKAGCEMHGVLGNWLMGFEIWSARDTEISSFQLWLNQVFDLPLLTWSLPTRREIETTCRLSLTWVLVDIM